MRAGYALFHGRRAVTAFLAMGLAASLVLVFANRSEEVVVLFPPDGLAEALPAGALVVATAPMQLTIRGSAGLTEALHAAGAKIVLDAGKGGCKATSLP
jgi:hypothetical protein